MTAPTTTPRVADVVPARYGPWQEIADFADLVTPTAATPRAMLVALVGDRVAHARHTMLVSFYEATVNEALNPDGVIFSHTTFRAGKTGAAASARTVIRQVLAELDLDRIVAQANASA